MGERGGAQFVPHARQYNPKYNAIEGSHEYNPRYNALQARVRVYMI